MHTLIFGTRSSTMPPPPPKKQFCQNLFGLTSSHSISAIVDRLTAQTSVEIKQEQNYCSSPELVIDSAHNSPEHIDVGQEDESESLMRNKSDSKSTPIDLSAKSLIPSSPESELAKNGQTTLSLERLISGPFLEDVRRQEHLVDAFLYSSHNNSPQTTSSFIPVHRFVICAYSSYCCQFFKSYPRQSQLVDQLRTFLSDGQQCEKALQQLAHSALGCNSIPVIILSVPHSDLQDLVSLMYNGTVQIDKQRIDSIKTSAQFLKINKIMIEETQQLLWQELKRSANCDTSLENKYQECNFSCQCCYNRKSNAANKIKTEKTTSNESSGESSNQETPIDINAAKQNYSNKLAKLLFHLNTNTNLPNEATNPISPQPSLQSSLNSLSPAYTLTDPLASHYLRTGLASNHPISIARSFSMNEINGHDPWPYHLTSALGPLSSQPSLVNLDNKDKSKEPTASLSIYSLQSRMFQQQQPDQELTNGQLSPAAAKYSPTELNSTLSNCYFNKSSDVLNPTTLAEFPAFQRQLSAPANLNYTQSLDPSLLWLDSEHSKSGSTDSGGSLSLVPNGNAESRGFDFESEKCRLLQQQFELQECFDQNGFRGEGSFRKRTQNTFHAAKYRDRRRQRIEQLYHDKDRLEKHQHSYLKKIRSLNATINEMIRARALIKNQHGKCYYECPVCHKTMQNIETTRTHLAHDHGRLDPPSSEDLVLAKLAQFDKLNNNTTQST